MVELKNTVDMMLSDDYKERFKAEYWQVRNRKEKLEKMLVRYMDGTLEFTPKCSIELLTEQSWAMAKYIKTLEKRAKIEEIELFSN